MRDRHHLHPTLTVNSCCGPVIGDYYNKCTCSLTIESMVDTAVQLHLCLNNMLIILLNLKGKSMFTLPHTVTKFLNIQHATEAQVQLKGLLAKYEGITNISMQVKVVGINEIEIVLIDDHQLQRNREKDYIYSCT